MSAVLTIDHPAWDKTADGLPVRAVNSGSGLWVATWGPNELEMRCVSGSEDHKPTIVTTHPSTLPDTVPAALRDGLQTLGTSHRMANPWLWDAITTAILRQVVRADQARRLYRTWCSTYGTTVPVGEQTLAVAPDHRTVLELPDEAFAVVGAKFHRTALQAAATHYEEYRTHWRRMDAGDLVDALTSIPRIGPWTAAAAAADYTGDFHIYPHDDLAVRTWAAQIAPAYPWPDKKDRAFGPLWTGWAATDRTTLHTLTLSTLTWGSHAR
ncbi:hypothetical protein AB0D12_33825 [Streptomyces sp. NPDC048479]|uniref:hypothetical protein n=1 Tax=Streptomyces sp. NPDC048479 TaxID=3154725 RepID=UPI0034406233